jgi:hypothetical protein
MRYLKYFNLYESTIQSVSAYVMSNFSRLKSRVPNSEELSDDDIVSILCDYFMKNPDSMSEYSISSIGRPNSFVLPSLMNIGGVYKYK